MCFVVVDGLFLLFICCCCSTAQATPSSCSQSETRLDLKKLGCFVDVFFNKIFYSFLRRENGARKRA